MDDAPRPPGPPVQPAVPPASPADGVRFAFGTLTAVPVAVPRWDRVAARRGMCWAPVVGLAVGGAAALAGTVALLAGAGPLLSAVAAVAVPAVLTRGLHLDGLADVADGLGSGRPAAEALRIMKRSDIGPFGVVALVLVLLAQVAALQELFARGALAGAAGAVLAGAASRAALTWSCRVSVPAARPEGLGAAVAGSVPSGAAWAVAAGTGLAGAALGAAGSAGPLPGTVPGGAALGAAAVVAALGAAELLLRRCRRRFGGVTGDVLGASAEAAGTMAVVAMTVGG